MNEITQLQQPIAHITAGSNHPFTSGLGDVGLESTWVPVITAL